MSKKQKAPPRIARAPKQHSCRTMSTVRLYASSSSSRDINDAPRYIDVFFVDVLVLFSPFVLRHVAPTAHAAQPCNVHACHECPSARASCDARKCACVSPIKLNYTFFMVFCRHAAPPALLIQPPCRLAATLTLYNSATWRPLVARNAAVRVRYVVNIVTS